MPLVILILIICGIGAFFILPPMWGIILLIVAGVLLFTGASGG